MDVATVKTKAHADEAVLMRGRIDLLQTTLKRIAKHILEFPLDAGRKRALQIVLSRIRLYERCYLALYGRGKARDNAISELSVAEQDTGEIIRIAGAGHGKGRIDCPACDVDVSSGFPVSLARLCMTCHKGIQHAVSEIVEDGLQDAGGAVGLSTHPSGPEIAPGANENVKVGILASRWECEKCGEKEPRP